MPKSKNEAHECGQLPSKTYYQGEPRKSILDPHLSVLEMLERPELNEVTTRSELPRTDFQQLNPGQPLQISISKSWEAIRKTDYSFLANRTNYLSQNNAVGVLSSSDTSEEERDTYLSPSLDGEATRPTTAANISLLDPLPRSGVNYTEDDKETVTVSMANTATPLVMPKLSLCHRVSETKILLLGKPARKFCAGIPKTYQKMFEIGSLSKLTKQEITRRYFAVVIIFDDLSLAIDLLDKLCEKTVHPTVIPICQKGQRHNLSSVLKKYTATNRINLFCHPVTMSNHHEKHRMLKTLYQIYNDSESECDTIESIKNHSRKSKKRIGSVKYWALWTTSVTIGVGIGCCISLLLTSKYILLSPRLVQMNSLRTISMTPTQPPEKPSHNMIHYFYYLCKTTITNLNYTLKHMLMEKFDSSRTWIQTLGVEFSCDNSILELNKMMPLDFITL
ncbi:HHR236Wp [Eremothecium sinecaudum]|uniref:HHR236Wp n=1 Tax=Eremothecium sinecaudum TaxID=45286 RepID=A0A0X8HWZ6_9SACH|nr:HHR236Wp [Eremothecium sinecaudum]AMD23005.1 HHR236Wp [Eremothecium sinecaudum]